MLRNVVFNEIKSVLPDIKESHLLRPKDSKFGDFAIHLNTINNKENIENIISKLSKKQIFSKINIHGQFINFTLSLNTLYKEVNNIITQEKINIKDTETILFEFGDPNTHKLPHIGHFFSYFFGDSCSRILEICGNKVYRANYQGDIGLHVAKALYIFKKKDNKPSKDNLEEYVKFLQKCYQEGSKIYEENEEAKKEIDNLNKLIYKKDKSIFKDWEETRTLNFSYYRELEKRFNIFYDKFYPESEIYDYGLKITKENIGKVFEESQGAIIFDAKKYGLHTRVFINKYGNPTYEAKDIGLMYKKQEDFTFDRAIIDTASEQNEYWKVVGKAIELIFPKMKKRLLHLGHGMISLKSGAKMSSRTGNILSAIDLIKEIQSRIVNLYYSNKKIQSKDLEILTFASLKYAFLKSDWKKNMTFDIDESVRLNGNSGLYLLYTYARCSSLLKKSKYRLDNYNKEFDQTKNNKYENEILRHLLMYQETIKDASSRYSPHLICTFLYELSKLFNNMYEHEPILKAEGNDKLTRLYITYVISYVLKHGLNLLGIQTLEQL